MIVTENDVRDLITKYHQEDVAAIATQIPLSERNLEIISNMSKYLGTISKRWRGPNWNGHDCPRENAERVSIYPRDFKRGMKWFLPEEEFIEKFSCQEKIEEPLTDRDKLISESDRANENRKLAIEARTILMTNIMEYIILLV